MIKVNVTYNNEKIKIVEMKGHSLYSESGTDIVCASASTIAIMTVNLFETFEKQNNVSVESTDGYLKISVLRNCNTTQKLLKSMIEHLTQLANQYPKNIKIN